MQRLRRRELRSRELLATYSIGTRKEQKVASFVPKLFSQKCDPVPDHTR
jgi:hypothetical protein